MCEGAHARARVRSLQNLQRSMRIRFPSACAIEASRGLKGVMDFKCPDRMAICHTRALQAYLSLANQPMHQNDDHERSFYNLGCNRVDGPSRSGLIEGLVDFKERKNKAVIWKALDFG
jgi:hypothetical protein